MVGPVTEQISDHVWQIGTFEFSQYIIGRDPCLIMEGGISLQSLLILEQLHKLGISFDSIRYICILHSHFDHIGTFPLIKKKATYAKIASGEKNQEILSNDRILKRMLTSSKFATEFAKKAGFLTEIYDIESFNPIHIDVPLKEHDTLKIDTLPIEFTDLSGHSPDAVGAYLPDDGLFFVSDMAGLYLPDGTIRPTYYFNLKDYETSLEKVLTFDIETICFGHNGTISGYKKVKTFLERSIDSTNMLKKQIKKRFEAGKDMGELARQYAHEAQRGFTSFLPYEHNMMLSRLIIRRTLEYFGLPSEGLK